MYYTIKKSEGGRLFIEDGKNGLLVNPYQEEDLSLKEGDEVRLGHSRPYEYINIVATKVKIGERREGWQYKDHLEVIPYKEEIEAYHKDFMSVTRRSISDYINRDND